MACTAKGICTMRIHALPTIRTKKNPQRTRKPQGKIPCKITLRHQMVLYAKHKLHTHAPNTNNAHMHTHILHHTERTHTHYTTQNVDTHDPQYTQGRASVHTHAWQFRNAHSFESHLSKYGSARNETDTHTHTHTHHTHVHTQTVSTKI